MPANSKRADRSRWLENRRRNQVERFDGRFAAIYDENWGEIYPSHAGMVERFLNLCPPGSEILDAACGTGKYWPMILASGRRPHGIDQSAGMLRRARAKFPDVPAELLAMTDLTATEAYDGAMCVDAMEDVPPEEWPAVLGAFHQALRPGRYLYLTVERIDAAELEVEQRLAVEAGLPVVPGESVQGTGPEEDDGYHFFPTEERVRDWLAGAGFVPVGGGRRLLLAPDRPPALSVPETASSAGYARSNSSTATVTSQPVPALISSRVTPG